MNYLTKTLIRILLVKFGAPASFKAEYLYSVCDAQNSVALPWCTKTSYELLAVLKPTVH